MEKCLSQGLIKKVPVKTDEYERLTDEVKKNPHQLFKAINDPNNAKGSYFFKMKAFFDNEKKQNQNLKKKKIVVGFQPKQIKELEAPFASFPMPNLKTMKVNNIAKEKFTTLPPMNASYRPQRKQYSPKEVKQYMTSTIDLSQPDFTFCEIENIGKHSEYVKMRLEYEADKRFNEKYSKLQKHKKLGQSQSMPKLKGTKGSNNSKIRNSMYILPHLNRQTPARRQRKVQNAYTTLGRLY
mmetsp:Transcript_27777/g.24573  ORF Transcript_27777/g.24573 Transcript_27777/m.24573 type:complete len:239 (+) Transcript_27777:122-838(+)